MIPVDSLPHQKGRTMRVIRSGRFAALALGVGLCAAAAGRADSQVEPRPCDGAVCPGNSYSPCHYWTPAVYRWRAWHHCPGQYLYATDRFPEMPPTYQIIKYPCRAVDPAAYYGNTTEQR
jgi:hypothetical protein